MIKTVAADADDQYDNRFARQGRTSGVPVNTTWFGRLACDDARLVTAAAVAAALVAVSSCAAHASGSAGSTGASVVAAQSTPSPSSPASAHPVAVASIATSVGSAGSTAGSPASAVGSAVTSPPPMPAPPVAFTVQDPATGNHFEVVLTPGDPSFGQFIAAIPGVGLVQPTKAATVTINANHTDTLAYSGAGGLDAAAHLDPVFGADYQPSGHALAATLILTGTADPAHQTASLDLIVNGTDHHFGTPVASDATATVTAVLAALNTDNWATLYRLSDSQIRTALTVQQYTALGSASGTFSHVTTDGAITYTTSTAGIHSASVPFTATLTSPTGTRSTQHGSVEMVDDSQGWQLHAIAGPDSESGAATG
jgi:hypothetical protein